MSGLAKATLQEISADEKGTPLGDPIPVQFNPNSLRLQLSNQVEGGESRGRQARQYLGSSSTVLSLELVFDTADEGTTEQPRSVREKTALLEKFVLPRGQGEDKQAPPRVRFHWGDLVLDGVIDSLNIDFDHFAPSGVPLRAKVGLSIKEQDPKYEFLKSGPGANKGGGAPPPGGGGGGAPNRSALALGGEAAAQFAARVGLDPAAWRGLSFGAEASLSLQAGVEVEFNAGLSASAGLGVTAGVELGLSASLEASFGLEVGAGVAAKGIVGMGPPSVETAAGLSLAAAGGVSAAIGAVQIAKAEQAASDARRAFGTPAAPTGTTPLVATTVPRRGSATPLEVGAVSGGAQLPTGGAATAAAGLPELPPTAAPARPARPAQPRPPSVKAGIPIPAEARPAPPAPPLPTPDPRAIAYGFGVPLRPRVVGAADLRAGATRGAVTLRRGIETDPVNVPDPTSPPWERLPVDPARSASDRVQERRQPGCRCGCGGASRKGGAPCRCGSKR